jgi:acetyltransferase-like isoleucine patch superfamily enzyme
MAGREHADLKAAFSLSISRDSPPGEGIYFPGISNSTMRTRFTEWEHPVIPEGELTKYHWLVQHAGNLKLGRYTDIGAFTYINALHGVTIEDHVQVGSHCSIYSVSTIDNRKGAVLLGRNCRIGSHTVIMPGVTVGENSIVGAQSYVNRDIPANVVAFGTPARVRRPLTKREMAGGPGEPE